MIVKIAMKNINTGRLVEELGAAGLVPILSSVGWAGFRALTDRVCEPIPVRTAVGSSSINGVVTTDFADPGELRFVFTRDLTPVEDAALVSVLTAHVATVLSSEQVRSDQDVTDLNALLATDRLVYLAHLSAWDTYTTVQKIDATKEMFLILAKALRIIIRSQRGAAI